MFCEKVLNLGRRQFLPGGAVFAAGTVVTANTGTAAQAAPADARIRYPSTRLGNIADLQVNEQLEVNYPDADAPGVLLKLGQAVADGVGADGDIVGFSTLCPHKGYPLSFNPADRSFNCPGHYSRFDAEAGGQQIWGQATQNLPQYLLRVDAKGNIYAEGVDELLYDRLSNLL